MKVVGGSVTASNMSNWIDDSETRYSIREEV